MPRFFSSKVYEIVTRIHGVESAYRQTNARSELQHEELHRQEAKTDEIRVLGIPPFPFPNDAHSHVC